MKTNLIILIVFILAAILAYQNFIINVSPSEPLGVYRIIRDKEIQKGDKVALCLNIPLQEVGLKRGYLLPARRCQMTEPLIKTIVAVPGDAVILKNNEIIVNSKVLPYPTKYVDSHGRKLDVFPRGIYKNIKTYWLVGTNDPDSWDSRYWGGVEQKQILFLIRPVCYSWHEF